MHNFEEVTETTYSAGFKERVFALGKLTHAELPSDEERVAQVDVLLQEHYQETGRDPKPYLLTRLANYILGAELKSRDVDKVTKAAYPVMSDYQLERRVKTQMPMVTDNLDFLDTKFNKGLDSLAKTTIKKAEY